MAGRLVGAPKDVAAAEREIVPVLLTARPQAVGYGQAGSPAGLAAWLLVHGGFAR